MIGVGGDLMLSKRVTVRAEVNFEPSKENYINLNASAAQSGLNSLPIQSRMTLYFNGIYQPMNEESGSKAGGRDRRRES